MIATRALVLIGAVGFVAVTGGLGWTFLAADRDKEPFPIAQVAAPSAPDVPLRDVSGQERQLSDFKGRVVILNFWATWCAPCRHEMPSLHRLQQRFPDGEVAVLAVSVDTNRSDLNRYLSQNQFAFEVFWDPGQEAAATFNATTFPHTYVVDREGRLLDVIVGASDWDSSDKVAYLSQLSMMN